MVWLNLLSIAFHLNECAPVLYAWAYYLNTSMTVLGLLPIAFSFQCTPVPAFAPGKIGLIHGQVLVA